MKTDQTRVLLQVAALTNTVTEAWSSFEKTLNCKQDDKHVLILHCVNYFNCYLATTWVRSMW